jgi:uncharacterized protein (DUF2147 family)
MRCRHFLCLFLVFCLNWALHAENITGFWQTMDKKTNLPTSIIAIYSYENKYYGRIIATYNKDGVIEETIYAPKSRAPGIVGNPYYCGLDIVWDAKPNSKTSRFKGYVVDPRKGRVYDAQIWNRDGNLILRGEVFIFGKNIVWPPFSEENFTKDFQKPNLATFVPHIPEVKD